jgi:hypothetical protein
VGKVDAVTARSSAASSGPSASGSPCSRSCRAQSQKEGPGRTGPAQTTDSSVYMVTSAAIEFMASSGDWSCRQIRPAPAG